MKNKRYILSLLIAIIGLIGLISGTSYAILNGNVNSSNTQVIKAGKIQVRLTEKYDNITTNLYALDDTEGLIVADKYDFTVTNVGSAPAKYDIKLLNTASDNQKLSDEYVKIGLKVNGKEMGPMRLSSVNNIIDTNVVNNDEIIRYEMRIWLDKASETAIASQTGKKVILKLKIEATQSNEKYISTYPVYRNSTAQIYYTGSMLEAGSYTGYCVVNQTNNFNSCNSLHVGGQTQAKCEELLDAITDNLPSNDGYTCQAGSWTSPGIAGATEDNTTISAATFLKHNIDKEDESVESTEVCYRLNNEVNCLKYGKEEYESNKQLMTETFTSNSCQEGRDEGVKLYTCQSGTLIVTAGDNGSIKATENSVDCNIDIINQISTCSPQGT